MIIRLKTFSKKKETKEERITRRDNTKRRDAYAKLAASSTILGGLSGVVLRRVRIVHARIGA